MSNQQSARDALRGVWDGLLTESLPLALEEGQEKAAAAAVVAAVWPAMHTDDMIRLDRADSGFLVCGPKIPLGLESCLLEVLAPLAEARLRGLCPGNRHARGKELRHLIREELTRHKDVIRDAVDKLFEARDTDRFCSPIAVRDRVLVQLSDYILDDLRKPGSRNECEAKRKLKLLTALATPGGSRTERETRLCRIRDGSTKSFPYVLKYLNRGVCPSVISFPPGGAITLQGFTPGLLAKFPEARHVRICLERYQRREGVITRFIDPDGPVAPGLDELYTAQPSFRERPGSGLLVHKSLALAESRRDFLRIPDGIVCAVSLGVLLESLLRQAASGLALGGGSTARGGELLRRVNAKVPLGGQTVELLETVFHQRSLNLRDAMAHGAFFAADEARLASVLAGLSQAMHHLGNDLRTSGVDAKVYATPRWDDGRMLDIGSRAILEKEYQGEHNLTIRLLSQGRWAWWAEWQKMQAIIPDKFYMGQAASLLWVSGQEDAKRGRDDETHHFAAIFAGLVVLEELFRAVYEAYGLPVLNVQEEDANRVRCQLAILDDRTENLLERASLQAVFSLSDDKDPLWQALKTVQTVRDLVLHGAWQALQEPMHLYHHLILKIIYMLCGVIAIDQQSSEDTTAQD
jgi:hypothetical protein